MEYQSLSKLFYRSREHTRYTLVEQELQNRLNAPSTFTIDFNTAHGQLFIAVPQKMSILLEEILRKERKITKLMQSLPEIARDEILRSFAVDEVINSNSIENIRSTRQQIEEALHTKSDSLHKRRFKEFARLYLDIAASNYMLPQEPKDIREIYDKILAGEDIEEPPDGKLFRKGPVYITNGLKSVHAGLAPEKKITEAMQAMLDLAYSNNIPEVYAAIASHYIFEYTHPFYDGNGRCGRYLLSLFLEASLSKPTVLSLSKAIENNKRSYYKAFDFAEKPLNHAELTFFVFDMLQMIADAQDELLEKLVLCNDRFEAIKKMCEKMSTENLYSAKEIALIFGLAQKKEFGMFPSASLELLSSLLNLGSQQTRKYMTRLSQKGIALKVNKRNPLTFALTDEFFTKHFGK